MLIVKVYINQKQIDELRILNLGLKRRKGLGDKHTLYEADMKSKNERVLIWHQRKRGWEDLVKITLEKFE